MWRRTEFSTIVTWILKFPFVTCKDRKWDLFAMNFLTCVFISKIILFKIIRVLWLSACISPLTVFALISLRTGCTSVVIVSLRYTSWTETTHGQSENTPTEHMTRVSSCFYSLRVKKRWENNRNVQKHISENDNYDTTIHGLIHNAFNLGSPSATKRGQWTQKGSLVLWVGEGTGARFTVVMGTSDHTVEPWSAAFTPITLGVVLTLLHTHTINKCINYIYEDTFLLTLMCVLSPHPPASRSSSCVCVWCGFESNIWLRRLFIGSCNTIKIKKTLSAYSERFSSLKKN